MHLALAIAVAIWLALTVLNHFPTVSKRLGRFDVFRVLPRWSFFAPNPGVHDYILAYRVVDESHSTSAWQNSELSHPRPRFSWMWNPHRREAKVLNDLVQTLRLQMQRGICDESNVMFTLPYLMILNFVNQSVLRQQKEPRLIQFVILQATGHTDRKLETVLLSHQHKVAR